METSLLSVKNVSKHFGGLAAITDISFDVKKGEVIGLMGPNGAGKTTLINLLAGEYQSDSGSIHFNGRDIAGLSPFKICRTGIARTYQIPQPFPNLTVRENILVASMYGAGLKREVAEIEALKLFDMVNLTEKKDAFCRDLNTISLKKLELARSLASNPVLILLDEVGAGSTEAEVPQILETIKKIREMGKTIIMVEHIIKVMVEAVDRIIVMNNGQKMVEGTPLEVMDNQDVIDAYLG